MLGVIVDTKKIGCNDDLEDKPFDSAGQDMAEIVAPKAADDELLRMTTEVVAAYVSNNTLATAQLGDIIHAWKSFTAKQANKQLGLTGTFWAPDYFDGYIRDQTHLNVAVHYINENPVKAGSVTSAEQWRWSSAWEGNVGTVGVPPAS